MHAERERLLLATAAVGCGVWDYNADEDILYCDARWYKILGRDPARPLRSIDEFRRCIHPEDVERATEVKATMAELLATHRDYHITFRVVRPTGEVRWVKSAACLVEGTSTSPTRAVGAIVDITEEVTATAALAESERRFKALAETLPQIIFSATGDGTVDYLNSRWYEFTGASAAVDIGRAWKDFIHPDDREKVIGAWDQAVNTGGRYDLEYRYRHQRGEYRWLHAMASPLRNDKGHITRWFGSQTDIHAAKILDIEKELVAGELDHRVKNILALVQGLIHLSVRDEPAMAPFAAHLQRRLMALSKAHSLVRDKKTEAAQASLISLLATLLSAYESAAADRAQRSFHSGWTLLNVSGVERIWVWVFAGKTQKRIKGYTGKNADFRRNRALPRLLRALKVAPAPCARFRSGCACSSGERPPPAISLPFRAIRP